MEISRRKLLKAGLLAIPLAGLGAYGYARGPGRTGIVTKEVDVPVRDLPAELEGFRIVHLSDFHIDPLMEQEYHAKAVRIANALNPDVIALTGDYVSYKAESVSELSPVLGELKAKYGVYGSLGNHDGWHGPGRVRGSLEKAGIRAFKNDGVSLRSEGIPLYVAGLESFWAESADAPRALSGRQGDEIGVLLCHEPDVFHPMAGEIPFSLMLSGHTHGGQVRCPGFGAPVLPRFGKRYVRGLFERKGVHLHVNPGIGTVDHPVRFFCRPEVSSLTLRRMV